MAKKLLGKKEVFVKNHLQLSIRTVLLEKAPFEVAYKELNSVPFKVRKCISWEEFLHGLKSTFSLMYITSIKKDYFRENPLDYLIITHDTDGVTKKPEVVYKLHVIKKNGIRFK